MRLRVPALLVSALTVGLASALVAPADAAPAAPAVPSAVAVPSAAGDVLEMTAITVPIAATRPSGSLVLRGAETALRSASPSDVRISGTDATSGAKVLLSFTAPTGKPFFIKHSTGFGSYTLAPRSTGRAAGATASWNGRSCAVDSGTLTFGDLTSSARGVTALQAHYQLFCQAGTRLQGIVVIGYGDQVRYAEALASGTGPQDLGSLALGSDTRVDVPFTYHGSPTTTRYPANALTWVRAVGRDGYDPAAAPGVTLVDDGCNVSGLAEGQVCTVVLNVHPTTRGVGTFFVPLGAAIGGYAAVVYTTRPAG